MDAYQKHEQRVIEKVIDLLKTKPDSFSARWFDKTSLQSSVRSSDRQILIMIKTGQIITPIQLNMTRKQKRIIRKLLDPIVKKDSDYLIQSFLQDDKTITEKK